jgi:hypothetical protein
METLKYIGLMLAALAGVVTIMALSLWLCTFGLPGVIAAVVVYLGGFYLLRRVFKPYMQG